VANSLTLPLTCTRVPFDGTPRSDFASTVMEPLPSSTLYSWNGTSGMPKLRVTTPVMLTVCNRTETAARIEHYFRNGDAHWPEMLASARTLRVDSKVLEKAEIGETESMGLGRAALNIKMPLREMMRNFFDELKSASSGYASISYKIGDFREADVVRLDILVGGEIAAAFSRIVSRQKMETEAEKTVEKLYNILPRQMFVTKIQGQAAGRIISSRTLSALKKDVTQHMYGGDITRKMKLREKQKKGKKKMAERGRVNIPQDVFMKMMRSGE